MYENAIKSVSQFTRPIHTIVRYYKSNIISPSAATLFFINDDGWALTCKHVAANLIAADKVNKNYSNFSDKATKIKKSASIKQLENQFNYKKGSPIEIRNNFVNCINGNLNVRVIPHKDIDLALLHFTDYTKLICNSFPVFPKDTSGLVQGKFLCRLGYPFAEFTNFEYDKNKDQTIWTQKGQRSSPSFPLDGMVTRRLKNKNSIFGFEMSRPGLRGQSGGPAFDSEGKIWGIQSMTAHLDLNFDVDIKVNRKGQTKKIKESALLHVGHCIHIDRIKEFLNDNSVKFSEA